MIKLTMIAGLALMLAACGGNEAAKDVQVGNKTGAVVLDNAKAKGKKGGSKGDRMMNNYVNFMGDMATAMESVKDQESAEKAAHDISILAAKMNGLAKDFESLENNKLGQAGFHLALMSRQTELMAAQSRLSKQMQRIQFEQPEVMGMLSAEIDKVEMR